ncbi:MAG: hypothetical protein LBP76_13505 [Treponema sp.]|jgi:hypothetical protein|nr:hypothetical protein [Treponema sp.]
MTDKNRAPVSAKDITLIAAWIGGLVLLGALLWLPTQTVRDRAFQNAVNQVLERRETEFRLESRIPFNSLNSGQKRLGTWFRLLDSEKRGLVFSIMNGGILFPCMAVVTADGFVEIVIFLNPETLSGTIPEGLVNRYVLRIEKNTKERVKTPADRRGEL